MITSCDGAWAPGPLPEPRWIREPPEECARGARHELLEYYDDCSANELPPEECGAGAGSAVCLGGRVTTYCTTSSDCPADMRCADDGYSGEFDPATSGEAVGICEKVCSPGGDRLECVRCDMGCANAGFCKPWDATWYGD